MLVCVCIHSQDLIFKTLCLFCFLLPERSSNQELIELLSELCHQSQPPSSQPHSSQPPQPLLSKSLPSHSPSSQLPLSPSPSVGQTILKKIGRSVSVLSSSLFSSPSASPSPHPEDKQGREVSRPEVHPTSMHDFTKGADNAVDRNKLYAKLISPGTMASNGAESLPGAVEQEGGHVINDGELLVSIKLQRSDVQLNSSVSLKSGVSKSAIQQSLQGMDTASVNITTPSPRQSLPGVDPGVVELGESFSGGRAGDEMDKLLLSESECDILRESLQEGVKSVRKVLTSRTSEIGATNSENEDFSFPKSDDQSDSSIVDFMESELPWNIFPEKHSPPRQSSQVSSQERQRRNVLAERTRRDLVSLVVCEEGEGGEGESMEEEEDEEEMLQAMWDDGMCAMEGDDKEAEAKETKIHQLDGGGATPPSLKSPNMSTLKRSKARVRLGLRRKRPQLAVKPSSPQKEETHIAFEQPQWSEELSQPPTDASLQQENMPMSVNKEPLVPQTSTAEAVTLAESEATHSSGQDMLPPLCTLRVPHRLSLRTRRCKMRWRTVEKELKPELYSILKKRALSCKFELELKKICTSPPSSVVSRTEMEASKELDVDPLPPPSSVVSRTEMEASKELDVDPLPPPSSVVSRTEMEASKELDVDPLPPPSSVVSGTEMEASKEPNVDPLPPPSSVVSGTEMEARKEPKVDPLPVIEKKKGKRGRKRKRKNMNRDSTSSCGRSSRANWKKRVEHLKKSLNKVEVNATRPTPSGYAYDITLDAAPLSGPSLGPGDSSGVAATPSGMQSVVSVGNQKLTVSNSKNPSLWPDSGIDPYLGQCGEETKPSVPQLVCSGGAGSGTSAGGPESSLTQDKSEENLLLSSLTLRGVAVGVASKCDMEVNSDFHLCVSSESDVEEGEEMGEMVGSGKSVDLFKTRKEFTLTTHPAGEKVVSTALEEVTPGMPPALLDIAPPTLKEMTCHYPRGDGPVKGSVWCPLVPPLSSKDLSDSSHLYHIPSVIATKPFYSNSGDIQSAK